MPERSTEDQLRQEYFQLLPDIRRVGEFLETRIRHLVLPVTQDLAGHEHVLVSARIKDCESAVEKLRRKSEGGTFDEDNPEQYTLASLNDLAGVRVLAFPRHRVSQVDELVRTQFLDWDADPIADENDGAEPLALKYQGLCEASAVVRGEVQIMSMLVGLFWEVEHSAMYKADPKFKGVAESLEMQECRQDVHRALRRFEDTFESIIDR